jgi:hypothetical protein
MCNDNAAAPVTKRFARPPMKLRRMNWKQQRSASLLQTRTHSGIGYSTHPNRVRTLEVHLFTLSVTQRHTLPARFNVEYLRPKYKKNEKAVVAHGILANSEKIRLCAFSKTRGTEPKIVGRT